MKEATISNLNARGEVIGKDLSELSDLKDIENLDLKGFEITDDIINVLNGLPNLMYLNLYSCNSSKKINVDLRNLKKIVIDNCKEFDLSGIEFPENVLIVGCGVVDISKLLLENNVKDLSINSSEIINVTFLEKAKGLKRLNVDGSNLDNEEILKKLKIKVSNEFEYHPIG